MDNEFDTLFTRSYHPGIPFLPAQLPPLQAGGQLPPSSGGPTTGRGGEEQQPHASGIDVGTRLTDDDMLDLSVRKVYRRMGSPILVVCGPNATSGGWCALKLLDPQALERIKALDSTAPETLRRNFEEEALNWCRLWPHPFILLTGGLTRLPAWDNLPVLVMEYASEGTLADRLESAYQLHDPQPIALNEALRWAQQIVVALDAIHRSDEYCERAPLIHADVKPSNILLTGETARLADFSLTRTIAALPQNVIARGTVAVTYGGQSATEVPFMRDEKAGITAGDIISVKGVLQQPPSRFHYHLHIPPEPTEPRISSNGLASGTPPYMPPEQWLGPTHLRTASDVYAFGVLLFQVFCGMVTTPHLPTGVGSLFEDLPGWFRAHNRLPSRRLIDPDLPVLSRGPLADLARRDVGLAERLRDQLDRLIMRCFGSIDTRPSASDLVKELAEIARACGYQPIRVPPAFPRIPQNEAAYWSNLASTYAHIGRREPALDMAQRAVDKQQLDPVLKFNLGRLHADEHRYHDALGEYARAEELLSAQQLAWGSPISYMLPKYQGVALMRLGRYAAAVEAFRRSLARRADSATTCYNLAKAYESWATEALSQPDERRKRLEQAHAAAQDALRINPNLLQAKRLLKSIEGALETI